MIRKIIKGAIGLTASGAGTLAASAVLLGNKRVDAWETLTPDDADDGGFVTLSDGARMHYVQRGDQGEPVILIHGLTDSTRGWSQNLDALAQQQRVWAIDLIGFGYSSRVTEPTYSLNYFAKAVREFMDAQGIERASMVGHSLGGAVTLEFARGYPDRANKLILIAPGTYLVNLVAPINLVARVPHVPRALVGFAMTSEQVLLRTWRNARGDPSSLTLEEATMRMHPTRVKGTADALVAMMGSRWANVLTEQLKEITTPTLILCGDKDRVVPLRHGKRHARTLPNAEFVIIEGAGHVPHSEYPELVNRLMLDFLTRDEKNLAKVSDRSQG